MHVVCSLFYIAANLNLFNCPRQCSNITKLWWKVLHAICCKCYTLSSIERILKIDLFDEVKADYT